MQQRPLGRAGSTVLGLGCTGTSGMYGPSDRAESMAAICAAQEAGQRDPATQMLSLDSEKAG